MSAALELRLRLPLADFELDVSFTSRAAALGLFGPSGAGKTSVLEAVCGWRRVREGRVAVGQRTLFDTGARIDLAAPARRVGYVPQDLLLFPHWDVRRNLLAGAGGHAQRSVLPAVAEVLELSDLLARSVGSLSGGERQRVALGRALCAEPDLLLLDEPLASLDAALRRRILPFLLRVRARLGTRLLFVSHDATEISAVCDEVVVLRAGRLVAQGEPAEVFAGPGGELAGDVELENVLRGRVETLSGGTATLELEAGVALVVPRAELAVGDTAVVAVRSDDVLIALERPRGVSARNVLAAQVEALVERGDEVLVRARLGGSVRLAAALTPVAVRELELAPGREVSFLIKTRACRVLAALSAER